MPYSLPGIGGDDHGWHHLKQIRQFPSDGGSFHLFPIHIFIGRSGALISPQSTDEDFIRQNIRFLQLKIHRLISFDFYLPCLGFISDIGYLQLIVSLIYIRKRKFRSEERRVGKDRGAWYG